ncbi:hypothetical protein [Paenibacillus lentus]|uniref:Uncharacterized protein n=1 Tax=Paenibacillus lentus TaxID=1338368 RepID=A0A3S8RSS8_9BACL|nr:hypothetical protein [Paenibacillus lentus]AZK45787.1 hypothetical protein EIM92_05860 [Paenibacillus lentus]
MTDRKDRNMELRESAGNGSSNGQNQTMGNGGEGGNGRLSQFKNHNTHGGDVPNEYIASEKRK